MDHAEISLIRNQFGARHWPKFVESVQVQGLRGWTGQAIKFSFPVSAIVGENGTGKSTILKATACAYENEVPGKQFFPSSFFVDTHWDQISGVTLTYRISQGENILPVQIKKPSRRWSFPDTRPRRHVFFFDISRTVPLDASAGYARIARLAAAETATDSLHADFLERFSHIMGRPYEGARFVTPDVDTKRDVGLVRRSFGEISQFHQGAGEDSTLDLMRSLSNIPNSSLIIIDEVEASLHPRAQRRLVRFLLWLSRQKRIQVIISTHSPYVLEELPQEARILLLPGPAGINVVYGASPEFAMSRIDDSTHPELYVFVEDRESEILLREIVAASARGQALLPRIGFVAVGPANVVRILGELGHANRLPYKALGALDGEQPAVAGIVNLPGAQAPERVVFEGLRGLQWPELPQRFGVGAADLFQYLEDAMLDPDHHSWTRIVGDRILKSRSSVWEVLAREWVSTCLRDADRDALLAAIEAKLNL